MKEYKGEKVLEQLEARLVPPNSNYPDCMCELILTGKHFFVLEDNFDGTYETHFQFSIAQMETMELMTQKGLGNSSGNRHSAGWYALATVVGALGGLLVVPGRNSKIEEKTEFLKIDYNDEAGNKDTIYFKDMQANSKKIRKAFGKAKEEQLQFPEIYV